MSKLLLRGILQQCINQSGGEPPVAGEWEYDGGITVGFATYLAGVADHYGFCDDSTNLTMGAMSPSDGYTKAIFWDMGNQKLYVYFVDSAHTYWEASCTSIEINGVEFTGFDSNGALSLSYNPFPPVGTFCSIKMNYNWDLEVILTVGEWGGFLYGWSTLGFGSTSPQLAAAPDGVFWDSSALEIQTGDYLGYRCLTAISINGVVFSDINTMGIISNVTTNPFPAVGETCVVKLKFEWSYEGIMTVGYDFGVEGYGDGAYYMFTMGSFSPSNPQVSNYNPVSALFYDRGWLTLADGEYGAKCANYVEINGVLYGPFMDHNIVLPSNPFPAVGETCTIKLR